MRIQLNLAPVLTLWAAVVAARPGFDWQEALTLGRGVAYLNGYCSETCGFDDDEDGLRQIPGGEYKKRALGQLDREWRLTMRAVSKSVLALSALAFAAPVFTFAADIPIGRLEYEHNCAECHGVTGKGNGWLSGFLKEPVPSLAQLKKNNGGVFPVEHVYEVIDGRREVGKHGPRLMPIWGKTLSHSEIVALIAYISTLQE